MNAPPRLLGNAVQAPSFITDERDRARFLRASINWLYYNGSLYENVQGWRHNSVTRYFYSRIRALVKLIEFVVDRAADYIEGVDEHFSIQVNKEGPQYRQINDVIKRLLDFNDFYSGRHVLTQFGVISGHVVVNLRFIPDDRVTGGPNIYWRNIDSRAYFPTFESDAPQKTQFIQSVRLQWEEQDQNGSLIQFREEHDAERSRLWTPGATLSDTPDREVPHGLGRVPFVDWQQLPSPDYFGRDGLSALWEGTDAANELYSLMYDIAKRTANPKFVANAPRPNNPASVTDKQPGYKVSESGEKVIDIGDTETGNIIWLGSKDATLSRLADDPRFTEFVAFLDNLQQSIKQTAPEFDLEKVQALGANVSGYAVRLILGPFIKKIGKMRSLTDEGVRNMIYASLKILDNTTTLTLPQDFVATDIEITREPIATDNPMELLQRMTAGKDAALISRKSAARRLGFAKSDEEWEEENKLIQADRRLEQGAKPLANKSVNTEM